MSETRIARCGVVRNVKNSSDTWVLAWCGNGSLRDYAAPLVAPDFLNEKQQAKPRNATCWLIRNWPRYEAEQFGLYVEHVVEVTLQGEFVRVLAYSPLKVTATSLAKAARLYAGAASNEASALRRLLPPFLNDYMWLVENAQWHSYPVSDRTRNFVLQQVRLATLVSSFYALTPLFPLRALLASKHEMPRKRLFDVVQTNPLALCFDTARTEAMWPAVLRPHLVPLWRLEHIQNWYAIVTWTSSNRRPEDDTCIHASPQVAAGVQRLMATPDDVRDFDQALQFFANASRLWRACGMFSSRASLAPDFAALRPLAVHVLERHAGFEVMFTDDDERRGVRFLAAQRFVLARQLAGIMGKTLDCDDEAEQPSKRQRLDAIDEEAAPASGTVCVYACAYPDQAHAFKDVFQRRFGAGRALVLSASENGVLELQRQGLPSAESVRSFLTTTKRAHDVQLCMIDQVHRLDAGDLIRLLTCLGFSGSEHRSKLRDGETCACPRCWHPRTRALDLLLVGDPDAPSNCDELLFKSLWRAHDAFFSWAYWNEPESEQAPPASLALRWPRLIRSSVAEFTAPYVEVVTAETLRKQSLPPVLIVHTQIELAAILVQLLRKLRSECTQLYARNNEDAKRLSDALPARDRLLATNQRVLVADRGFVGKLSYVGQEQSCYCPFFQHSPLATLSELQVPKSPTCFFVATGNHSTALTHETCCPDSAVNLRGRASSHHLKSAHVLTLRECPQVRVENAILWVGATTTREDIRTCAARVYGRLYLLSSSLECAQAAWLRPDITETQLDAVIADQIH